MYGTAPSELGLVGPVGEHSCLPAGPIYGGLHRKHPFFERSKELLVLSRSEREEVLVGEDGSLIASIEVNEILTEESSVEFLIETSVPLRVEQSGGTRFSLPRTQPRHRHAIVIDERTRVNFDLDPRKTNLDPRKESYLRILLNGNRVKICFHFPKTVPIRRYELVEERGVRITVP